LVKLVTPVNGRSLDITAGSGTHGLCCEELNNEEGYNIEWVNIEMLNTEKEPYYNIAKQRIENIHKELNN
jgi:site-specific DNA-methyltransferase (adenine-specific)